MKDAVAKLKSMNWKMFAIDHGEKLVLGLVATLLLLAFWKTKWTTYDSEFGRTPQDLQNQVDAARSSFLASTWPAPEAEKFPLSAGLKENEVKALLSDDENTRLATIEQRLGKYSYSTEPYWPLYPRKERIKEPEYLPVEDLIADAGRVILEFQSAQQPQTVAQPEPAQKPSINSIIRNGDSLLQPANTPPPVSTSAPQTKSYGEGQRYISIRGIFPLFRQLQKIAVAMNEPNVSKAADLVEFTDFRLFRQTAVPGPDPWAGEWELITVDSAVDILSRIADFDADILDPGVTDSVFTMPLPRRVVGYWSAHATHPKLENFELSFEQMQQEQLINEKMIEEYTRMQMELAEQQKVKKGGFDAVQHNLRQIRSRVLTGGDAQRTTQRIKRELDEENIKADLIDQIRQRETAAGRLLLFRYIDFNVKPGNSYRYKVKLVLRNPFLGRPQKDVASPEVALGELRETPESIPTAPVTVPVDTKYFLADIKYGREAKAVLNIFQWYQPVGTYINEENLEVSLGDFVGGRVENSKLLDPSKPEFRDDATVVFDTNDVLVDINAPPPPSDLSAHMESLGLDRSSVARAFGIVDQALVANQYGEMVALDPVSTQPQLQQAVAERQELWGPFAPLLKAYRDKQSAEDATDDLRNRGRKYDDATRTTAGKTTKQRSSPLRKR